MTFYYDKLKDISKALAKYINKLDSEQKQEFCNLGPLLCNNKQALPYIIAAAICKHYIIDKGEKIYVTKLVAKKKNNTQLVSSDILQINHFHQFKKLGKIISKII